MALPQVLACSEVEKLWKSLALHRIGQFRDFGNGHSATAVRA